MAIINGRVQRCDNGDGIWATLTDNWGNFVQTQLDGTFSSTVAYDGYRITASASGTHSKQYTVTQSDIAAGWVTICLDPTPIVDCCFTGDTQVLMADGSELPIRRIRPGDCVLGNNGLLNRVVRVLLPVLGQRLLYSLNGSPPFVTAEHPFLSEKGWKAIDPQALLREGCELNVRQLTPGDRLVVCKGCLAPAGPSCSDEPAEIELDALALRSRRSFKFDSSTPLFNLVLDGDHTYIARGFVVHNKNGGGLY